jgi:hypothetical protein
MAIYSMLRSRAFILTGFIFFLSEAHAYELSTHAALTWAAINQSQLAGQSLQDQLDITPLVLAPSTPISELVLGPYSPTNTPFGNNFWDVSSGTVYSRPPSDSFEGGIVDRLTKRSVPLRSLTGWVMSGAVREDDGAGWPYSASDEPFFSPLADPFGMINRFCNHFFDPYHRGPGQNGALSDGPLPCLQNQVGGASPSANPDWAFGTTDAFASPTVVNSTRRNHFSVSDLYEYQTRLVKLLVSMGSPLRLQKT